MLEGAEGVVAFNFEIGLFTLQTLYPNAFGSITVSQRSEDAFVGGFEILPQFFGGQPGSRREYAIVRPTGEVELIAQELANGNHLCRHGCVYAERPFGLVGFYGIFLLEDVAEFVDPV